MQQPLRIGLIAPVASAVHRLASRSIEQVVWLLAEGLVARGHEVTLFATGDSATAACLAATYAKGYTEDESAWDWRLREALNAAAAFERSEEFDVIHSHAYHYALPYTRLVDTPTIHSYHVALDDDVAEAYLRYPDAHLVAASDWQRRHAGLPGIPVVHHGIEFDSFPFQPERGDYLLFLGTMLADKGPAGAIEVAQRAGLPLVMAGAVNDAHFDGTVRPLVDGDAVRYVGPVGALERNSLLAHAAALVYPLVAPEPFGMVVIEAMACGTPVAAVGIGAVPELVEVGRTGYLARDTASLAEIVPAALRLDRAQVRAHARARFDQRRMVEDYERLYRRVCLGREEAVHA